MWRVTWRGLLVRRVRLVLTAVAIALGVGFTSGVFVTTDTLQSAYRGLFDEVVAGVDLVVRSPAGFGGSATPRARVPAPLVDTVASVDGVKSAEGVVQGYAQFVDRTGAPIQNGPALTLGLSWPDLGGAGPLRIIGKGRAPAGSNEVAMDAATAAAFDYAVGDDVQVVLNGPAEWFTITALFEIGTSNDLGGVTAAAFDVATAQRVFAAVESYDAIYVVTDPSVDDAVVAARITAAVGGYEATPALEFAEQTGAPVRIALDLVQYALLGFAGIGLLVGSFIIFNTFSIIVGQRVRELGLLRALGASPTQVWRSVLGEAMVLGTFGAVAGLVFGVIAARALLLVLPVVGFDVPDAPLVFEPRTAILAVGVGVLVTVMAAAVPARRAARTAPVEAISDPNPAGTRGLAARSIAGLTTLVGAIVAIAIGVQIATTDVIVGVVAVTIASALLLVALVVLGPVIVRAVVAAFGEGLPLVVGVLGRLARANAKRNPRRTAATAMALVTGIALVSMSSVFVHSFRVSLRNGVGDGLRADWVLSGEQFRGFSPELANSLRTLPEVAVASGIRFSDARVDNSVQRIAGMEPEGLGQLVDLGVIDGDLSTFRTGMVLVHADAVPQVRAGDTVVVELPGLGATPRQVAAVYTNQNFTGIVPINVIIDSHQFELAFGGAQRDTYALVKTQGDPALARTAIENALANYPNVSMFTRSEFLAAQEEPIDLVAGVLVALLVLSVVIALLGVTNTLLLTVFERTRELGLLRAIGMTRRQVRSLVRLEALLVAAAGGVIGLGLGLIWAWVLARALATQGLTQFSIPAPQLMVLVAVGLVAGVVAAIGPARRASRLDVLAAIAEE